MARFLYRASRRRSASAPARPDPTRSEPTTRRPIGPHRFFPRAERRGPKRMKTAKDVLSAIKDNDVKYVDFRFTDPRGKWQHVTFDVSIIEEDTFAEGVMFDGSSISG